MVLMGVALPINFLCKMDGMPLVNRILSLGFQWTWEKNVL